MVALRQFRRWFARGVGWFATAVCLLIVVSEVLWLYDPPFVEAPRQGVAIVGPIIVTVLSVFIAWRWKRASGMALVVGATALGTFAHVTAERNKIAAAVILGGPFLLAGILFLMSWWGSRRMAVR